MVKREYHFYKNYILQCKKAIEISENIEEIITTYESELNKFEVKVESKKDKSNSKIPKEQDDGPEQ